MPMHSQCIFTRTCFEIVIQLHAHWPIAMMIIAKTRWISFVEFPPLGCSDQWDYSTCTNYYNQRLCGYGFISSMCRRTCGSCQFEVNITDEIICSCNFRRHLSPTRSMHVQIIVVYFFLFVYLFLSLFFGLTKTSVKPCTLFALFAGQFYFIQNKKYENTRDHNYIK